MSFNFKEIISIFVIFALFYACPALAQVEQVCRYQVVDTESNSVLQSFEAIIQRFPNGSQRIHWMVNKPGRKTKEEYILDTQYETKLWRVESFNGKTNYQGRNKDGRLFLTGRFKDEQITKTLKINPKYPFYVNPKFGLQQFIKSGKKEWKFWGLRNDDLSKHLMVATNQGEEIIEINGQKVPAIKVYWTVSGIGSMFFERTYWFRKSDGVYLRQIVDKKYVRNLVYEQKRQSHGK